MLNEEYAIKIAFAPAYTSCLVARGVFRANVRAATLRPRPDLEMLFVAVDIAEGRVMCAWLIPSEAYAQTLREPNRQGRHVFTASMKPDSADRWRRYG